MITNYKQLASALDVFTCDGPESHQGRWLHYNHDHGAVDVTDTAIIHWRPRTFTLRGLRRFLMLAAESNFHRVGFSVLPDDEAIVSDTWAAWPSWRRLYEASRAADIYASNLLHRRFPAKIKREDQQRAYIALMGDGRRHDPQARTRAYAWARKGLT